MKKLTSAEIRQSYLDFFQSKAHLIVPSASLIPQDDPTILFTNAGMNQFKDVFLGLVTPAATRVTDSQKCMRVSGKHNDLEEVGPSPYHHTFFEMLGNWSFGDYYKKEAIAWAWELLTEVWEFPKERLYATVFEDDKGLISADEEAWGYWQNETDIDPAHILYDGRKDNFWEMGETGPCGPCSEIHYDRGPEHCDKKDVPGHQCQVNGDCTRYLEFWNLVFIQYNSLGEGKLEPLPAQHVDTGLGFARVALIMQGAESNYDTDLFMPIIQRTRELADQSEEQARQNYIPYRVIADHCQAATFLIGDGALPGNVGRGYVLRMIIRRAARFARKLGFSRPFMAGVADVVIQNMGGHYRELRDRREHILKTITIEEERFLHTLDQSLNQLDQFLVGLPSDTKVLSGQDAFYLYATSGSPLEITRDIAKERGYSVDEVGFWTAMEAHRAASRGAEIETYGTGLAAYAELLDQLKTEGSLGDEGVRQDPYGPTQRQAPLVALLHDGQRVQTAQPGDEIELLLPVTPFYVESGGQVSDTGSIVSAQEPADWQVQITGTRQPLPGLILHVGWVHQGAPRQGEQAIIQVDGQRRQDIMRNHTATHLLHRELRRVLGAHVQQGGSLVTPDRLRFDFTHHTAPTPDELAQVSRQVNDAILANYPLDFRHEPYAQALEQGVTALFGEKYGDVVRVVRIGPASQPYSQELCGGTHVHETGAIGPLRIISESSVGAGLRRIEALTGRAAQRLIAGQLDVLQAAAGALECQPDKVEQKVRAVLQETQAAHKEINRLRHELARRDFEKLLDQAQELDGLALLSARVDVSQVDTMRDMADWFRARYPSGVVCLGAVIDQRPMLIAAVTPNLLKRGLHAGRLVQSVARVVGGGGGGRPTLAQAGGRDASRLDEALAGVPDLVKQMLESR
jgi:alanyl-tRNA synthetase